jgi:hypothetical protein
MRQRRKGKEGPEGLREYRMAPGSLARQHPTRARPSTANEAINQRYGLILKYRELVTQTLRNSYPEVLFTTLKDFMFILQE